MGMETQCPQMAPSHHRPCPVEVVGDNNVSPSSKPAEEPAITLRGPSCQPGPQQRKEPQQKWKKARGSTQGVNPSSGFTFPRSLLHTRCPRPGTWSRALCPP